MLLLGPKKRGKMQIVMYGRKAIMNLKQINLGRESHLVRSSWWNFTIQVRTLPEVFPQRATGEGPLGTGTLRKSQLWFLQHGDHQKFPIQTEIQEWTHPVLSWSFCSGSLTNISTKISVIVEYVICFPVWLSCLLFVHLIWYDVTSLLAEFFYLFTNGFLWV